VREIRDGFYREQHRSCEQVIDNVGMLNLIAVVATLVCLAAAIACWYQIANTEED